MKNQNQNFHSSLKETNLTYILTYFQFLLTLVIKSQLCNRTSNSNLSLVDPVNLSHDQLTKLFQVYTQTIQTSQTATQLQLNYPLILTLKSTNEWLKEMENFQFLKTSFMDQCHKLNQINQLIEFSNLRPTIYFSNSLKDQFKYVFGKNKFTYKSERHKYLKTKTQLRWLIMRLQLKCV